jgi:ANTAR domain
MEDVVVAQALTEQAKGMTSERQRTRVDDAFDRLRRHAQPDRHRSRPPRTHGSLNG